MTNTVWPVNAVSSSPTYDAKNARQAMAAAAGGARPGRPLGARSGVRPGTPTTTVTATSTTWTVGAHAGILDLETSAAAGPYWYAIDANNTGSMTAADGSNPRVDIVWVRLDDPAEADGSSTPAVVVGYTAGTPASSPSAPATPSRCMVLAQINVPKSGGGSPTVTWTAPYAVAPGGIIPVRTQAERDVLSAYATSECPVYVDRLDIRAIQRHDGTAWQSVAHATTGSRALSWTRAGSGTTAFGTGAWAWLVSGVITDAPNGAWYVSATLNVTNTATSSSLVKLNDATSGTDFAPDQRADIPSTLTQRISIDGVYSHAGGTFSPRVGINVATGSPEVLNGTNAVLRAVFIG